MKNIKNKFHLICIATLVVLGMGISYAQENSPEIKPEVESVQQQPVQPIAEQQATSFASWAKKMAVFNLSHALSVNIADSYRNTLYHPAAFVAGKVTCSFVRNLYTNYSAGKLFNTGWKALIPEDIQETVHVYTKNPFITPLMIACSLGPVWGYYTGVSPLIPMIMGSVLWSMVEK